MSWLLQSPYISSAARKGPPGSPLIRRFQVRCSLQVRIRSNGVYTVPSTLSNSSNFGLASGGYNVVLAFGDNQEDPGWLPGNHGFPGINGIRPDQCVVLGFV